MNQPGIINISAQDLPQIKLSGIFEHRKDSFARLYKGNYHALHYYLYAGSIKLDNRNYHFQPGDITITAPDIASQYTLDRDGQHLCLHFDQPAGSLSLAEYIPSSLLPADSVAQLQNIIRYASMPSESQQTGKALASNLLHRFLLELFNYQAKPTPAQTKCENALRKLIEYIEMNLDQDLTIPSLSRIAGLSQNYLAKNFKAAYGQTIKNYILNRQIERACYLLDNTTMQIKEIAFQSGITDPQYFNKLFKSIKKISPTAYRDRAGVLQLAR